MCGGAEAKFMLLVWCCGGAVVEGGLCVAEGVAEGMVFEVWWC